MSYAFISYSHDDDIYVARLRERLHELGFETWQDIDLKRGSLWEDGIIEAVESSGAVIVVMSSSSAKSRYVKKEILWAQNFKKPIFPILLSGTHFLNLIDIQYEELNASNKYLPRLEFFNDLQEFVKRTPQSHEPPKPIPNKPKDYVITHPIDTSETEKLRIGLQFWSEHIRQGSTDFYGLAMLSLSYIQNNQHERAMFFFKKAKKIEPRVIDFKWMSDNYNWNDKHKRLLEKLTSSDDLWNPQIS